MVRDQAIMRELSRIGWQVLVVWECETKRDLKYLEKRLEEFLES